MVAFANINCVKGLLSLLDHYSLLKHIEGDSSPLETEGILEVVQKKGYGPAAKQLLDAVNEDPEEQKAIIEAFELQDLVDDSNIIKASHIWKKALNSPAKREDLKAALLKADQVPGLRPKVKKALKDLLQILDVISNDKTFSKGERPGVEVYKTPYAEKGIGPAIMALYKSLSADDMYMLSKKFGLKETKPKTFLENILAKPGDDSDLLDALCQIDPKECKQEPLKLASELVQTQEIIDQSSDPRSICKPPGVDEFGRPMQDLRYSIDYVDCKKYDALQEMDPGERIMRLINEEKQRFSNAYFYTFKKKPVTVKFFAKFDISKEGKIAGEVNISKADPPLKNNPAMKKFAEKIIAILKQIDYRYANLEATVEIEYPFKFTPSL